MCETVLRPRRRRGAPVDATRYTREHDEVVPRHVGEEFEDIQEIAIDEVNRDALTRERRASGVPQTLDTARARDDIDTVANHRSPRGADDEIEDAVPGNVLEARRELAFDLRVHHPRKAHLRVQSANDALDRLFLHV